MTSPVYYILRFVISNADCARKCGTRVVHKIINIGKHIKHTEKKKNRERKKEKKIEREKEEKRERERYGGVLFTMRFTRAKWKEECLVSVSPRFRRCV